MHLHPCPREETRTPRAKKIWTRIKSDQKPHIIFTAAIPELLRDGYRKRGSQWSRFSRLKSMQTTEKVCLMSTVCMAMTNYEDIEVQFIFLGFLKKFLYLPCISSCQIECRNMLQSTERLAFRDSDVWFSTLFLPRSLYEPQKSLRFPVAVSL